MILHPGVLALLGGSVVALAMLVAACRVGLQVLRHWDFTSSSERQLRLERRTFLVSSLASLALAAGATERVKPGGSTEVTVQASDPDGLATIELQVSGPETEPVQTRAVTGTDATETFTVTAAPSRTAARSASITSSIAPSTSARIQARARGGAGCCTWCPTTWAPTRTAASPASPPA